MAVLASALIVLLSLAGVSNGAAGNGKAPYVLTAGQVKKMREHGPLLVVDARPESEFRNFRIPGSIRIPLHVLKTKPFLKQRPFIIVNKGFACDKLHQVCLNLRSSGFPAFILAGGLNSWVREGGEMTGDSLNPSSILEISPVEFYRQRTHCAGLLIDAGQTGNSRDLFPNAIHIPFTDIETFKDQLIKQSERIGFDLCSTIVIYNETGQYNRMEHAAGQVRTPPVFFLRKGLAGYRGFLNQYRSMRMPDEPEHVSASGCSPP